MAEGQRRGYNWAALGLLFSGAFLTGVAVVLLRSWSRDRELRAEGVLVQGQVERKETQAGDQDGPSYVIHYRFETPGGQTVRGSSRVGARLEGAVNGTGPTVPVRYLPSDPSVNAWDVALAEADGPAVIGAAGLGLIGLMLLVAATAGLFMPRERFLRWWQEGRP